MNDRNRFLAGVAVFAAMTGCMGVEDGSSQGALGAALAYKSPVFDPATDVGQDFTTASDWDRSVWTNQYGSGAWFSKSESGVLLAMSASTGWKTTAFQEDTAPGNCAAGFGYGTFHVRAGIPAEQKAQGPGVNIILWRMDNDWIDPKLGDIITEDDIMEAWSENGQGTATRHFYDASKKNGGTNGQIFSGLGDVTGLHDFDEVWAAGSMTLYKDGVQVSRLTGAQVPKDSAHGGCNYSLGAQVINPNGYTQTGLPTVQMWVANAWHSESTSAPGGGTTPPAPTPDMSTPERDAATAPPSTSRTITLRNPNSGKCVDVPGASKSSGVQLQQYDCNGTGAQKFEVKSNSNGSVTLVNTNSGLCIDVAGARTADGTKIQQWTCNGTAGQNFTLDVIDAADDTYNVKTYNGSCLDVTAWAKTDGTLIQEWTCGGGPEQVFVVEND